MIFRAGPPGDEKANTLRYGSMAMATGYGFGLLTRSAASMRHTLRSILPNGSTAVTLAPQDTTETSLEHQEAVPGPRVWQRVYKRFGVMGLVVVGLGTSMPYGLQLWQYYQTHELTDNAYVVGELIPVLRVSRVLSWRCTLETTSRWKPDKCWPSLIRVTSRCVSSRPRWR